MTRARTTAGRRAARRTRRTWGTWEEFVDAIRGDAPDNINLATAFKSHPARHSELNVIDPLDGQVRYTVQASRGRSSRATTWSRFTMPSELAQLELHERLDAILKRLDAIEATLERLLPPEPAPAPEDSAPNA